MPDALPNNPYARPINATRPEGQMLVGEFYGQRATDKQLAGIHGRQVSPASRYVGKAIAVPADVVGPPPDRPRRGRPPGSKNRVKATIDDIVPLSELEEPATSPSDDNEHDAITEDDLFG